MASRRGFLGALAGLPFVGLAFSVPKRKMVHALLVRKDWNWERITVPAPLCERVTVLRAHEKRSRTLRRLASFPRVPNRSCYSAIYEEA